MDFLAGLSSGITQTLIGHPLDTIKTNKQNNIKVKGNLYKGLNYIDGFKKSLIINHRQNEIPINVFENWIENWLREINHNKQKYCLLNYDDYKKDKLQY